MPAANNTQSTALRAALWLAVSGKARTGHFGSSENISKNNLQISIKPDMKIIIMMELLSI